MIEESKLWSPLVMVEIDREGQEDKACDQPKVLYIDLNGGYSGVYTYKKKTIYNNLYILLSVSYISLKIYMLITCFS